MPSHFGYADLIDQDTWWQPARQNLLKLWEMEESHRAYTHAFLMREASNVLSAYHRYQAWCEKIGKPVPEAPLDVYQGDAAKWLATKPLMKALLRPVTVPDGDASRLDIAMKLVLPNDDSFPIAKRGFGIFDLGRFHISFFTEKGELWWKWKEALSPNFPADHVSSVLTDLGLDPLTSVLLAADLGEKLTFWAQPAVTCLAEWKYDGVSGALLRPKVERANELERTRVLLRDGSVWAASTVDANLAKV